MSQNTFSFKKTFISFLLIFFIPNLYSETIVLRNGNVKKGKILNQDKMTLVFEEKEGSEPEVFSKKEILKISYKDLTQAEINQILKESGGPEVLVVTPSDPVFDPTGGRRSITRRGAFLRSMVLPGWGQFYQNRKIAGTAYFMLFLGGLGFAGYQFKEYNSEHRDYDYKSQNYLIALGFRDSSSQFLARTEMYSQKVHMDRAIHRAEIASGVLAGIYLLNLFDVAFFHPKDNLSLRSAIFRDQMLIRVEYRF